MPGLYNHFSFSVRARRTKQDVESSGKFGCRWSQPFRGHEHGARRWNAFLRQGGLLRPQLGRRLSRRPPRRGLGGHGVDWACSFLWRQSVLHQPRRARGRRTCRRPAPVGNVVAGVEVSYDAEQGEGNIVGPVVVFPQDAFQTKVNDLFSVVGRLGYARGAGWPTPRAAMPTAKSS